MELQIQEERNINERQTNSSERQTNSSERQTNSSVIQTNSSERQTNSSERQTNPSEIQTNSSVIQTNSSERQTNSSERQTNSSERPTNPSVIQTNSSERQTSSSEIQTNSSERQTNPNERQTNPSVIQTNSSERQTSSSERQTNSSERQTNPNEIQTNSSERQTKSSERQTSSSEIQTNSSERQTSSSEIQTNSSERQTNPSVIQTNSSERQTSSSEIQTNSSERRTNPNERQTNSSERQTKSSEIQNNSGEIQTNSSGRQTNPSVIQTNSSERQTSSSEIQTNSCVKQTNSCVRQTSSCVTPERPRWFKWFILVNSYIINVIVTGIAFSFGVLYVKLLDEFKQGKARTAAIGSISIGLLFGVGPVAGILAKRFHTRPVAIFGSVVSFIGLLTTSYANSLEQLYGLYSILAGIGFGCLNLTAILCVTEHFQEKQGLACAISSSGCGVGNIIFPLIISELIASVGWRPSMQILSAFQLVTVLCSFLMFPKTSKLFPSCQIRKKSPKRKSSSFSVNSYPNISAVLKDLWMDGLIDMKSSFHSKRKHDSIINYIQFPTSSTNVIEDLGDFQIGNNNDMFTDERFSSTLYSSISVVDRYSLEYDQNLDANVKKGNNLFEYCQENMEQNVATKSNRYRNCINKYLCDITIFKNTKYLVFFCSCLLSATGAGVPAIIISDYAESFGTTTKKAAILVSVIGVTGFVGRLLAGAASCCSNLNILMLYSVAMLLSGVSTALIPLLQHFWFCMLFSALFGLFYGITAGLDPSILAYIVGNDNMAVSFGFFSLALGVGSTVSASLAGLLRDTTEHYNGSFYLAGVFLSVSAVCVLPMAIATRLRQRELKDASTCKCITLTGYHVLH